MDDPRRKRVAGGDVEKGQGKIPGMILKSVVVALAVALLPVVQKQSNIANQGRSWEVIELVVVGLAVSYGLMARRPEKPKDSNDHAQGTLHKMFDFAGVFDDFKADGVRDKVETWSSRWQPEEPLTVFAGDHKKKEGGEKPLLLPVRSLKSTLSNPDDVLGFLNDGKLAVQESKNEVRSGELLTVESGNFEEEVDHVMSANGESAVFLSPIPWASRSGGKEADPIEPPAIPSPIPWRSRTSNDGKQKSKPPQRPPPRPHSAHRNPQTPPPQQLSTPSPTIPPPAVTENGLCAKSGSSQHDHASASSDEVNPSTTPLSPAVFEARKASENGRSKDTEGSSHRSKSGDAASQSQQHSREVEIDSSTVLKQNIDIPSRKFLSPPPPPVYADVPFSNPLPPPPPPPLYPSHPKDEDHTACFSEHEGNLTAPPKVMFEVGSSDSEPESELELDHGEDQFAAGPDEVDKKAAQFIAKFHEQIRLQRQESIRRSQHRHEGKVHK